MAETRTVTWMDGANGPYAQEVPAELYDDFIASHDVVDNVETEDAINERLDGVNGVGNYTRNPDGSFTRQPDVVNAEPDAERPLYNGDGPRVVPADQNIRDYPGANPVIVDDTPETTADDSPLFDQTRRESYVEPGHAE